MLDDSIRAGSRSAVVYSFTARTLTEIGLDLGFEDVVADLMCETLFFGVVGDADDYQRFHRAYNSGQSFAGIPMNRAWGSPLAVEVQRTLRLAGGARGGASQALASYGGIAGADLGVWDSSDGRFRYYAPALVGEAGAVRSYSAVSVQNAGLECASVELYVRSQADCGQVEPCESFELSPGERHVVELADCPWGSDAAAGWLVSTQPLAIVVDSLVDDKFVSYPAFPDPGSVTHIQDSVGGGSEVVFAPITYRDYQGWTTRLHVQNVSGSTEAEAKIYWMDRSGDVITTEIARICPRGSHTFELSAPQGASWVGYARVESRKWWSPDDPDVEWPSLVGVVESLGQEGSSGPVSLQQAEHAAHQRMLSEPDGFDWSVGGGAGGLTTGTGLIALPDLVKATSGTQVLTQSDVGVLNLVPKPGYTDLALYVYDQNGLLDYVCRKLNEKQLEYIDLGNWGYLAPNFVGSVVVSAVVWEHDVYDEHGKFLRNLVGLGAARVTRPSTDGSVRNSLGDGATGVLGAPMRGAKFNPGVTCPGVAPPVLLTPTPWPPYVTPTVTPTPDDRPTSVPTATAPPSPTVPVTHTPRVGFTLFLPSVKVEGTGPPGPTTTATATGDAPTKAPTSTGTLPTPAPTATGVAAGPPGPYVPPSPQVHLPVIGHNAEGGCETRVTVQNVGGEPCKVVLITWGAPGDCPPQASGPAKVECTGLVAPGGSWQLAAAQLPPDSRSASLFSFTVKTLEDIGVDLGFDDVVADLMCETLFFGVPGDADDYRRFKRAYDSGTEFAGVPQDLARGAPLAVTVDRSCPGDDTPAANANAGYRGVPATDVGAADPFFAKYRYHVPMAFGDKAGFDSVLYAQNASDECAQVEVRIRATNDCLRTQLCDTVDIAPGESRPIQLSSCSGSNWEGSAELTSNAPLAVVCDTAGRDVLLSYTGYPRNATGESDGVIGSRGSQVLFGPLLYSEYQGWDSGIVVYNLSSETAAKVKARFLDRSGDVITTLTNWICPLGSQTFLLPVVGAIPGDWVGSVRIESEEWWNPGDSDIREPTLVGVASLWKSTDEKRTGMAEAAAYGLLGEGESWDWVVGHGDGGLSSGVGLIAIPNLVKESDEGGSTSELAVTNLVAQPGFTTFSVCIYDQNGLLDYVCQTLNEKQVEYIDFQTWGFVNPGFRGSALISATGWHHSLFDNDGEYVRNLVGLGAVSVRRSKATLGVDVPGDETSITVGFPLRKESAERAAAALPKGLCPEPSLRPYPLRPAPGTAAAAAQLFAPALSRSYTAAPCANHIAVQNLGGEVVRAIALSWLDPSACGGECAGPADIYKTRPIQPGTSRYIRPEDLPPDVGSATIYAIREAEADRFESVLETHVAGDCAGYARFQQAFERGESFEGLDLGAVTGSPIAAEVLLNCGDDLNLSAAEPLAMPPAGVTGIQPGAGTTDAELPTSASYPALSAARLGDAHPSTGTYRYSVPLMAGSDHIGSAAHIQNAGTECASVELWVGGAADCEVRPRQCGIAEIPPGESIRFDLAECLSGDGEPPLSGWVEADQPLAATVQIYGRVEWSASLASYEAPAWWLPNPDDGVFAAGSPVAYGPLDYSEYQGWDSVVAVQNLGVDRRAKVSVVFLDRSGDRIVTLTDWLCPSSGRAFVLPKVAHLPGNWIGAVRVESISYTGPDGTTVDPPHVHAVLRLVRRQEDLPASAVTEAVAYRLLSEGEAFDWAAGRDGGGLESGTGIIAIPRLQKLQGQGLGGSELAIANLVPQPGVTGFVLGIYDENGLVDYVCERLNEQQVEYINLDSWGYINPGFGGSALVSAIYWNHQVVSRGQPARNLVGLGAVLLQRRGSLGTAEIGDELAAMPGIPLAPEFASDLMSVAAPGAVCPGPPRGQSALEK